MSSQKRSISVEIDKKEFNEPKDTYWIVYILFFLLGLVFIIPTSFFATAHAYWMYKFRDTSYDGDPDDADHRTTLQVEFSPGTIIASQLSIVVFNIFTMFFGHKYRLNLKMFGPLFVMLFLFIVGAMFIHIDTDNWQTLFFFVTMLIIAAISAMDTIFGLTVFAILSNFPTPYLGTYVAGQGMGMLVTSFLQVISLAIGISTTGSALVYFWIAIGILAISLGLLAAITNRNEFYRYTMRNYIETKQKMLPFRETIDIFKKIWPSSAMMFFWVVAVGLVHPSITSLVVSEGQGSGNQWNNVYFVPVVSFLTLAIFDYIGRIIGVKFAFNIKPIWLVVLCACRTIVFVPLVMLCNAQPRNHLSVVFPHDYQFILIVVFMGLTGGYYGSMIQLTVPKLVPPEKLEDALQINMIAGSVIMASTCFLSFVSVDII